MVRSRDGDSVEVGVGAPCGARECEECGRLFVAAWDDACVVVVAGLYRANLYL